MSKRINYSRNEVEKYLDAHRKSTFLNTSEIVEFTTYCISRGWTDLSKEFFSLPEISAPVEMRLIKYDDLVTKVRHEFEKTVDLAANSDEGRDHIDGLIIAYASKMNGWDDLASKVIAVYDIQPLSAELDKIMQDPKRKFYK